jgi:hypothetical protein
MIKTPCPYCQNPEMPDPPKTPRPYGKCPACGKKSRAVVSEGKDGTKYVGYVKAARLSEDMIIFPVRIARGDVEKLKRFVNPSAAVRQAVKDYLERKGL